METILLQIPDDLAEQIKPHRHELARILQLGLSQLATSEIESPRDRTLRALQATGLIQPIAPSLLSRYAVDSPRSRRPPLRLPGKPLSEIIIEQRGRL